MPTPTGADTQRRPSRRSAMKSAQGDIERAAAVTDDEFVAQYLRPSDGSWTQWTHPRTRQEYTLCVKDVGLLSADELGACFDLVRDMSGADYAASSVGWHPDQKRDEMRSPGLRYILVKSAGSGVEGFTSLMPTFENSEPVIYCYEMQLSLPLQGGGLGRRLMELVLAAATHTPSVDKAMLTCFTANHKARQFYGRMGFVVDPSSPRDRKLRSGTRVTADYVILSCDVTRRTPGEAPGGR